VVRSDHDVGDDDVEGQCLRRDSSLPVVLTAVTASSTSCWASARAGVAITIAQGKPTQNGFVESLNGRFRAECLNAHWFLTLADAAEKMEDWRRYYNEVRPIGAIGHKVPISLLNPDGATSPPS
jgi:putative transposase